MLFEKASRSRLRVQTSRGLLPVEDLWTLPLPVLDEAAIALNEAIEKSSNKSFIRTKTKDNTVLELRFNIVKHIIDVRLAEEEAAEKAKEVRAKRNQLMTLIAQRKDEELSKKSLEELYKELDALEA